MKNTHYFFSFPFRRYSSLCVIALVLCLGLGFSSSAHDSSPGEALSQYLTFINLARAAEDVSFVNFMRSQVEEVEVNRLQFIYDTDRRLLARHQVSNFKVAESLSRLTESKFHQAANAAQAAVKKYEAKIWRKRAGWARNQTTESPEELAEINVKWRQEVLDISERGARDMRVIDKEFTYMYQGSYDLLRRGAMSPEDFTYYETLGKVGPRLVENFDKIVLESRQALTEAQRELAEFSGLAKEIP